MATLTPATEPVKFGSLLKVMCPNGYVINGTSDASKTYPCLTSGHFDVSFNVCVGELCLCLCVWKREGAKQNKQTENMNRLNNGMQLCMSAVTVKQQ